MLADQAKRDRILPERQVLVLADVAAPLLVWVKPYNGNV